MNLYKGLLHVHSTYSYDGRHSISEIAEFARRHHYDFVAMSEHSDTLTPKSVSTLVADCNQASDAFFQMIPGIEFTCEGNLHLIGLGIAAYTPSRDPLRVADFIRERRGIAVIAHPSRYQYRIPIPLAGRVHGIEVWNGAYDSRFVPNHHSLILLRRLRQHNSSLLAYGGQDLHAIVPRFHVSVQARCMSLTSDLVLRSLDRGSFRISTPLFRLSPRLVPGSLLLAQIRAARSVYTIAKHIRNRFLSREQIPSH